MEKNIYQMTMEIEAIKKQIAEAKEKEIQKVVSQESAKLLKAIQQDPNFSLRELEQIFKDFAYTVSKINNQ